MQRSIRIALMLLICFSIYANVNMSAGTDSVTVEGRPDTVRQNEELDSGKAPPQQVMPEGVEDWGNNNDKIRITSKTLNPPYGWLFRRFYEEEKDLNKTVPQVLTGPNYPSDWVDFDKGPPTPETPEVLKADSANIQFRAVFPQATNADKWPLRAEGNMTRIGGGGGGGGALAEKHWRVEVAAQYLRFINAGDEEVELATGFSHPNPVVKIGIGEHLRDINSGDLTVNSANATATVTIDGMILCDIADVVPDRSADITSVVIVVRDVNGTGGHIETQVPVTNVSNYNLQYDYRPINSDQDLPHPFIGKFQTQVTVPLTTGDLLVTAYAVNVLGNDGSDSFTVEVDSADIELDLDEDGHPVFQVVGVSPGHIGVSNNESTGRGTFNPIWVYVEDQEIDPNNIDSKYITFFDGNSFPLMIDPVDGRVRTKVPFIQVGRPFVFGSMPTNVINAEVNGTEQTATYKQIQRTLEYTYTAASPSNYYKYAQGTTVRHNWYSKRLKDGWTITGIEVFEKTGRTWTFSRALDAHSTVVSHKAIADHGGKGGREITLTLGPNSSEHKEKALKITLTKNGDTKVLKDEAKFQAVPLKTVLIAVDGFAYASAQSVITGAGATPTFEKVFQGSVQAANPALAALPTVTWVNWPGIFSGDAPKTTGWVGNSWFPREIVAGNQRYPVASANTSGLGIDQRQSVGIALGGATLTDAFDMRARALAGAGSMYDDMAGSFIPAGKNLIAESIRMFWDKTAAGNVRLDSTHFVSSDPHGHSAADAKTLDDDGDNILPQGFLIGDSIGTGPLAKARWKSKRDTLDILVAYFPGPDNVAHGIGAMTGNPVGPPPRWVHSRHNRHGGHAAALGCRAGEKRDRWCGQTACRRDRKGRLSERMSVCAGRGPWTDCLPQHRRVQYHLRRGGREGDSGPVRQRHRGRRPEHADVA